MKSLFNKEFFLINKIKKVWMSHADQVSKTSNKIFKVVASSTNSKFAIVENKLKRFLWNSIPSRGNPH